MNDMVILELKRARDATKAKQQPAVRLRGIDEYGPMLDWHRPWTDFPIGTEFAALSAEAGDGVASALPSPLPLQGEPVAAFYLYSEDLRRHREGVISQTGCVLLRHPTQPGDEERIPLYTAEALAAERARADRAEEMLNAYLETRKTDQWADRKDDLSEAITASHPLKTGRHDLYRQAMMLVGNRHSKYALVDLVNHFLAKEDSARTILKETPDEAR